MSADIVHLNTLPIPEAISVHVSLGITRRAKRHRCPSCKRRRELYAVEVTSGGNGGSEFRCAECWGIR